MQEVEVYELYYCFQLQVVESVEKSVNRSAGREHLVSEKLVRDWRKKKAELKALSRTV